MGTFSCANIIAADNILSMINVEEYSARMSSIRDNFIKLLAENTNCYIVNHNNFIKHQTESDIFVLIFDPLNQQKNILIISILCFYDNKISPICR